jgi:hypothetical protein
MWEHIQLNGDKTCLGDFLSEVNGLEAIERMNKTEQEGKWFFIYKNDAHRKINNLINSTLPVIFQEHISPGNKYEKNQVPSRPSKVQSLMGTYVSVLKTKLFQPNPQDEEETIYNTPP